MIGKTDYDLSPAFLADQFRLDDEYVLAGNRIVDRIELVGQPDGLTVWNLTNKIPLVDAGGSVVGTAGLTRNLGRDRPRAGPGVGVRAGPGPPAGPLPHDRDQPATGEARPHVGPGVRAEVPGVLPPHPAEIPAQAPDADGEPGPGLHAGARWRRSRSGAGSRTRATSPASSAATSAGPRASTASTTRRGRATPLLSQILPLLSKPRPRRPGIVSPFDRETSISRRRGGRPCGIRGRSSEA